MGFRLMSVGAVIALLGVAAGAFGAHGLEGKLSPESLQDYEVGVRYQMYHALALLLVSILAERTPRKLISAAGWLFAVGVLFFSGSIYGLVLGGWRWLIPFTPIGGSLLMIGWGCMAVAGFRKQA